MAQPVQLPARPQRRTLVVDVGGRFREPLARMLAEAGAEVRHAATYEDALALAGKGSIDVAVVPAPPGGRDESHEIYCDLVRSLELQGGAVLVIGENADALPEGAGPLVDLAAPTASVEEIRGRLAVMLRYHKVVSAMERELDNMQRLFRQLSGRFTEVDTEMRLAARLQDAFLPKGIKKVGPVTFATLYRPATFVSGDIYDIYRVDERHVGFYVADAVGHGMAASLLTMFIKNAVVAKRILEDEYQVLDPSETLRLLNERLCAQQLPNSQFVTAAFGLLHMPTLELRVARAGHPYPMLVGCDGAITEVRTSGGLLGLFEGEEFVGQSVRLRPGEKLILYSDGLEVAFTETPEQFDRTVVYREVLRELAGLPAEELLAAFSERLDNQPGSLNPQDDVTLVVVEITS
jgi:sigma-B regulation protein RsbU (phosphoserine phosphatase)